MTDRGRETVDSDHGTWDPEGAQSGHADGGAMDSRLAEEAGEDAARQEPQMETAEGEHPNSDEPAERAAVEGGDVAAPVEQTADNVESAEAEPSGAESIDKADEAEREDEAELAKADLEDPHGVVRVGEVDEEVRDRSIVKPGSVERGWWHGIGAGAMDPQELETIRLAGVPDLPRAPLAHRFVRYLVTGGLEAAFWKTAEWALDSFLPGAGFAVKPAHVIVGLVRAAVSFNNGRGVDLVIPVTEIAGGYSADLRFRLCEAHPPPLPSIGTSFGWNSASVPWLNHLALDGTSRPDHHPMDLAAPVAGMNSGADMVALTRRWEERAFAVAGRADGIDIHVITFVNRQALVGRVEIWSSGRPPYCPAWFRLHRNVSSPGDRRAVYLPGLWSSHAGCSGCLRGLRRVRMGGRRAGPAR